MTGCKKWKQGPWEDNTADGQRDSARKGRRDEPLYSPSIACGLFFMKKEKYGVCGSRIQTPSWCTRPSAVPYLTTAVLLSYELFCWNVSQRSLNMTLLYWLLWAGPGGCYEWTRSNRSERRCQDILAHKSLHGMKNVEIIWLFCSTETCLLALVVTTSSSKTAHSLAFSSICLHKSALFVQESVWIYTWKKVIFIKYFNMFLTCKTLCMKSVCFMT